MRKIMAFTATRAEYGLLKPILRGIKQSPKLELSLVVAGEHLVQWKGYTINEIKKDGFKINEIINSSLASDRKEALIKSVGLTTILLSDTIRKVEPNILLLLGDRYELLAPAIAALIQRAPIAHIAGGETTYGVLDEQVRHAITKMAHLHFPATWEYGWRIRQMGEEAWRIHVVGAPGIENIYNNDYMTPNELKDQFGIELQKPIMIVTYHPETLEKVNKTVIEIEELIKALKYFPQYQQVITYPGTEVGFQSIIEAWHRYATDNPNVILKESLGSKGYLGLMRLASVVIGNSSSGIIEAPSFHVPTVNIGERQKGRIRAGSIIDVPCEEKEIVKGIKKALEDRDFRQGLKGVVNPYDPYGDGNVSGRIIKVLEEIPINRKLLEKRLDFPSPEEKRNYHVQ
ncbi:GDP/UDP-N,N'-diacetylbacillosamine 2-epimerase (hydrolyzing) [Moorella thermoacetica]|uniref:GDP/UDP-N,N'-diacetylbacillosamine 2-epimerase (Hydrolyzing) n=1 Tax=Neomoorella thermoacetica TaxID=1525 RepID=A0A1J5JMB0_NEOTH|nr:UDP-N-acetylglucosamine 2-epimerase [Moorella thermoacetica]OIQ09844.1 GDP/UDP-N,N'-diacetylbacillosamine 2-epimerase (hydrolyzing) [Moorella thermoacetica]